MKLKKEKVEIKILENEKLEKDRYVESFGIGT